MGWATSIKMANQFKRLIIITQTICSALRSLWLLESHRGTEIKFSNSIDQKETTFQRSSGSQSSLKWNSVLKLEWLSFEFGDHNNFSDYIESRVKESIEQYKETNQ